jgi:hypothetical protein
MTLVDERFGSDVDLDRAPRCEFCGDEDRAVRVVLGEGFIVDDVQLTLEIGDVGEQVDARAADRAGADEHRVYARRCRERGVVERVGPAVVGQGARVARVDDLRRLCEAVAEHELENLVRAAAGGD